MRYFLSFSQGGNLDGCASYPAGEAANVAEARAEVRRLAAEHEGATISDDGLSSKWFGQRDSGGTPWHSVFATRMYRGGYYDHDGWWINPGDANYQCVEDEGCF